MAYLLPMMESEPEAQPSNSEDVLEVFDLGPVTEEDRFLNTRGASLNYVVHMIQSSGAFCADKSSLKGEEGGLKPEG